MFLCILFEKTMDVGSGIDKNGELPKYGKNVQLIYGGGSIKKNGIYDQVVEIFRGMARTLLRMAALCPTPSLKSCMRA